MSNLHDVMTTVIPLLPGAWELEWIADSHALAHGEMCSFIVLHDRNRPKRIWCKLLVEQQIGKRWYAEEPPVMTASLLRPPPVLAADIERRLLAPGQAYLVGLRQWTEQVIATQNRQVKMAEMLKQIGQGRDLFQRFDVGALRVGDPPHWESTIDRQAGAPWARVKLEVSVDFETACQIVEEVTKNGSR